jgi:hypothetical protein
MRTLVVLVAVLFCPAAVLAAQAADPYEKAEAEMRAELDNSFIVERGSVFVIAGNMSRRDFDRCKRGTVQDCAAALWKDFFKAKPNVPIKVYLFADKTTYEKWVKKLAGFDPHSPYGFYLRERKSLMMNIATGGGTLVHEMTHALMDPDFPDCPTWLFEGMGSLFEQCMVDAGGHILGRVNWRLPGLRKAGFVPLRELIETSEAQFRGDKESANYANARYLCLYLQERGLLRKFYATFRDAHKAGKDKTGWDSLVQTIGQPPEEFEKQWQAWVKTLKWPE